MEPPDRVWRERGLRSAVLAGDEQAWRVWYQETFDPLYAYVFWRSAGQRQRVEDVLQETWLTAVRRIRSFDPERGSFAGWVRGIAENVLRNELRRDRRQPRSVALSQAEAVPAGAGQAGIDNELNELQAQRIERALRAIPERYEAVLRAKYLDGQSVAEIASAWNETPKAIESLLTRSRQAFREAYLESETNHGPHDGH